VEIDPQWCKWSIILIPLVIGLLSAGQTVHTKQGPDFLDTLKTGWGVSYWISRGLIPTGTYVAWFFMQGQEHSPWAAFACGLGSEAVLRAKLFLGQENKQDIYKGFFDLIEWWQGIFITKAASVLSQQKIKFVRDRVGGETDFRDFADRVMRNAPAFREKEEEIRQTVDKLLKSFTAESPNVSAEEVNRFNKKHIFELSFDLLNLLDRRDFTELTNN
jgi:hypothetical protein